MERARQYGSQLAQRVSNKYQKAKTSAQEKYEEHRLKQVKSKLLKSLAKSGTPEAVALQVKAIDLEGNALSAIHFSDYHSAMMSQEEMTTEALVEAFKTCKGLEAASQVEDSPVRRLLAAVLLKDDKETARQKLLYLGLLYCKKVTPRLRANELWSSLGLSGLLTKDDARFKQAYTEIIKLSSVFAVSLLTALDHPNDPLSTFANAEALSEELIAKVHDEFVSNLFTRRKEQAFEFLDSLDQEGFVERMSQEDCA